MARSETITGLIFTLTLGYSGYSAALTQPPAMVPESISQPTAHTSQSPLPEVSVAEEGGSTLTEGSSQRDADDAAPPSKPRKKRKSSSPFERLRQLYLLPLLHPFGKGG